MIRVKISNKLAHKTVKRLKKKARIRKTVDGSAERPRLSVYRSAKHIYAQIIDDISGRTLAAASTVTEEAKGKKTEAAKMVGAAIAKKAIAKNIKEVVFDRSGFFYHGRVKAVADGAREAGLKF